MIGLVKFATQKSKIGSASAAITTVTVAANNSMPTAAAATKPNESRCFAMSSDYKHRIKLLDQTNVGDVRCGQNTHTHNTKTQVQKLCENLNWEI
jgi:hypothetical protein